MHIRFDRPPLRILMVAVWAGGWRRKNDCNKMQIFKFWTCARGMFTNKIVYSWNTFYNNWKSFYFMILDMFRIVLKSHRHQFPGVFFPEKIAWRLLRLCWNCIAPTERLNLLLRWNRWQRTKQRNVCGLFRNYIQRTILTVLWPILLFLMIYN